MSGPQIVTDAAVALGSAQTSRILESGLAIGAVATGLGAFLAGLAALRIAEAWKIWARRCDPKNPNFRPPSLGRKR